MKSNNLESCKRHFTVLHLATLRVGLILTKSDTSDASAVEQGNNIAVTLDHLLKENSDLNDKKSMLLICGTFFIMSDVK